MRTELGPNFAQDPDCSIVKKGSLHRWLRGSAFTARTGLALLIAGMVNPSAVEAASCSGSLLILGWRFVDSPTSGRPRILDATDFALGGVDFGVVELYDRAGKEKLEKWNRKNPGEKPKSVASANMTNVGNYSWARFNLAGECDVLDGNQRPAMQRWVFFPKDDKTVTYPEIVRQGRMAIHLAGRDEHRADVLQRIIGDPTFKVLTIREREEQAIRELFRQPLSPRAVTTLSDANKQLMGEQIAILKRQQEQEEGKKMAAQVAPQVELEQGEAQTGQVTPTTDEATTTSDTPDGYKSQGSIRMAPEGTLADVLPELPVVGRAGTGVGALALLVAAGYAAFRGIRHFRH